MVATFLSNLARARQQPFDLWSIGVLALCALILGPVLAVLSTALGDSGGLWTHLFNTVLGRYIGNTLVLMAGVGMVATVFGVGTAWVVSRYDFIGRSMLEWSLTALGGPFPTGTLSFQWTGRK